MAGRFSLGLPVSFGGAKEMGSTRVSVSSQNDYVRPPSGGIRASGYMECYVSARSQKGKMTPAEGRSP